MSAKRIPWELASGNEAIATGALHAGCRFYAGYPITPQNELIAHMAQHLPGQGGVFLQAESELAAINMVFGAAAAGVRAMTSSSSPGISLMQEGLSYIAGAELPAVVVNVMRGGPGLGNIAAAQSDYFQATRGGGHGDYHSIVLAPASVQEAYAFMPLAFDLADRYRMPALVLADGLLGQMREPVRYGYRRRCDAREKSPAWALTGCRNRAPRVVRSFYLQEGALETVNQRLQAKYRMVCAREQRSVALSLPDADIVLVAYGSMARVAQNVVRSARERGARVGLFCPKTLWPFPQQAFSALLRRRRRIRFLVVEMSYGQLVEDVRLAVNGKAAVAFLGRAGGGIPSESQVEKALRGL